MFSLNLYDAGGENDVIVMSHKKTVCWTFIRLKDELCIY